MGLLNAELEQGGVLKHEATESVDACLDEVGTRIARRRQSVDGGGEQVDRLGRVVGDADLGEHLQGLLVDELLLVVAQIAESGLGHGDSPVLRSLGSPAPGTATPESGTNPSTVASHAPGRAATVIRAAKHTARPRLPSRGA